MPRRRRNPSRRAGISLCSEFGRSYGSTAPLKHCKHLHAIGADDDVSVRALVGSAQARLGDTETALRTLRAILADGPADRMARTEISLWIALACYGTRDLDGADAALDAVPPDGGVLYVRALEYRGWVASARTHYTQAVTFFSDALRVLDACPERDSFVEANCIQALSHLAVERFDRMAWSVVVHRRATGDWHGSGLAYLRFLIALQAAAFAYDVEGDVFTAAAEASGAVELAPSTPYRVQALCSRAWISRCAGERLAHRDHVRTALQLFDGIGTWAPSGDETIVPLVLTEELANAGRHDDARRVFELYRAQAATSPMLAITRDKRRDGYERLVEAQLLEAEGEMEDAMSGYRDAFQIFCPLGYVRRSIVAAVRLIHLSPSEEYVWGHIDAVVAGIAKGSWIGPVADQLRRARHVAELTPLQREHLRLVCAGMSTPDIARIRKRSKHTVRNQIASLFDTFSVHTRAELVAECARLGILSSQAGVNTVAQSSRTVLMY